MRIVDHLPTHRPIEHDVRHDIVEPNGANSVSKIHIQKATEYCGGLALPIIYLKSLTNVKSVFIDSKQSLKKCSILSEVSNAKLILHHS
eukprot:scaffold317828_cov18-Prasinocladus_malaysianus.AAC.1